MISKKEQDYWLPSTSNESTVERLHASWLDFDICFNLCEIHWQLFQDIDIIECILWVNTPCDMNSFSDYDRRWSQVFRIWKQAGVTYDIIIIRTQFILSARSEELVGWTLCWPTTGGFSETDPFYKYPSSGNMYYILSQQPFETKRVSWIWCKI
jgi:hypothetical protein